MSPVARDKRMKLRYAGVCRICGSALAAGLEAVYEPSTKTVRCVDCSEHEVSATSRQGESVQVPSEEVDQGTPGASARREFERRRAAREHHVRGRHPRLGGLILALGQEPQSTENWATGAVGEERIGGRLNGMASDTMRVLHDRSVPRTRANIDHIAVTGTGIYVIDPKRYKGRPSLRVDGGIIRPRSEKLMVGTRDRTSLVHGVLRQVTLVKEIVGDHAPVMGVLCFVESDWPLLGGTFSVDGVDVLWPRKLFSMLRATGPVSVETIASLHRTIAGALPPA